ncbi:unnamed protein product, partial [Prorocentrum cordatum]
EHESGVDQLQEMFPSWERESLVDVLAAFSGDLERASHNLLQWTNQGGHPERRLDGRPKAKPQPASPYPAFSAPAGSRASGSGGRGSPRSSPRASSPRSSPRAVAPAPAPAMMPRQEYDRVIAARLSRKSNARLLGQAAKAAVHWRRRAREGHEGWRAGSGTKVAWAGDIGAGQAPSKPSHLTSREDHIMEGKELLRQRCIFLGLRELEMADDGNCQFRAVAQELFGSQ